MKQERNSLFYEGQIFSGDQELKSITAEKIIQTIRDDQKIKEQVSLLRRVQRVDDAAYKKQKTRLPFFIGARFRDNLRKMENLESVSAFVVDIDHCFQDLPYDSELVEQLKKDQRIYFMFRSPSGKGLKVVYLLDRPIEQPKIFSDFYRTFIYRFSQKYRLEEFVDTVTSDVTRVCFFSSDPHIYSNPNAVPIAVDPFVQNRESESGIGPDEVSSKEATDKESTEKREEKGPDKEQYRKILEKLGSRKSAIRRPQVKVPDQLEELMPHLQDQVVKYGFRIEEVNNIQYGKKVRISHSGIWAEINIFFGKRGFSVVMNPKTGSDSDLGEVAVRLAHEAISEYWLSGKVSTIEIAGNTSFTL